MPSLTAAQRNISYQHPPASTSSGSQDSAASGSGTTSRSIRTLNRRRDAPSYSPELPMVNMSTRTRAKQRAANEAQQELGRGSKASETSSSNKVDDALPASSSASSTTRPAGRKPSVIEISDSTDEEDGGNDEVRPTRAGSGGTAGDGSGTDSSARSKRSGAGESLLTRKKRKSNEGRPVSESATRNGQNSTGDDGQTRRRRLRVPDDSLARLTSPELDRGSRLSRARSRMRSYSSDSANSLSDDGVARGPAASGSGNIVPVPRSLVSAIVDSPDDGVTAPARNTRRSRPQVVVYRGPGTAPGGSNGETLPTRAERRRAATTVDLTAGSSSPAPLPSTSSHPVLEREGAGAILNNAINNAWMSAQALSAMRGDRMANLLGGDAISATDEASSASNANQTRVRYVAPTAVFKGKARAISRSPSVEQAGGSSTVFAHGRKKGEGIALRVDGADLSIDGSEVELVLPKEAAPGAAAIAVERLAADGLASAREGKVVYKSVTKPYDLDDEISCAICFEVMVSPVFLMCGHLFCQACLEPCLEKNDNTCPSCRVKSTGPAVRSCFADAIIKKHLHAVYTALEEQGKKAEADEARGERAAVELAAEDRRIAAAKAKSDERRRAEAAAAAANANANAYMAGAGAGMGRVGALGPAGAAYAAYRAPAAANGIQQYFVDAAGAGAGAGGGADNRLHWMQGIRAGRPVAVPAARGGGAGAGVDQAAPARHRERERERPRSAARALVGAAAAARAAAHGAGGGAGAEGIGPYIPDIRALAQQIGVLPGDLARMMQ